MHVLAGYVHAGIGYNKGIAKRFPSAPSQKMCYVRFS